MREQRVQRRQVPGLKAAARRPQEFTESAAEHRWEHRIAGTRRGQFDGRGGGRRGGYGTEPGERESSTTSWDMAAGVKAFDLLVGVVLVVRCAELYAAETAARSHGKEPLFRTRAHIRTHT